MVIQLRPDQQARLRRLAQKEKVSIAELVRRGVDFVLEREDPQGDRKSRALAVSGMLKGGASDLSANHDQHTWEE